ncbi:hypothetical protein RGQ29_029052 [Quercus rubra]|uniref:HAT C-terminal dimerisation domain-containing protein n=1 Tax=Quercus rubra TaxID=3512 RepID=A0AAN7EUT4_QUERU|nr:hypothetical protein RGQ29_029052 [Quercus rubra]
MPCSGGFYHRVALLHSLLASLYLIAPKLNNRLDSSMTLALILLVATTTIERAFSTMNIIKNRLHNQIEDLWMNDCLVTYIEKYIFKTIKCEEIMQRFQNMKNR